MAEVTMTNLSRTVLTREDEPATGGRQVKPSAVESEKSKEVGKMTKVCV